MGCDVSIDCEMVIVGHIVICNAFCGMNSLSPDTLSVEKWFEFEN